MDIYISADIEGVCGVCAWAETEGESEAFAAARARMTAEVAAACSGALEAGAARILVKDAHDTGRNIDPAALPEEAQLNRGWAGDPYCMVSGLERGDWDACVFLGYHAAAGTAGSPLAHTMATKVDYIEVNGQRVSEFTINAYTAGMLGVPVAFVSGDAAVCEQARRLVPGIAAVPTQKGDDASVTCLQPALAQRRIREVLAAQLDSGRYRDCLVALPSKFEIFLRYKEHTDARKASYFPGAELVEDKTVAFTCTDWMDALRLFLFTV